MLAQPDGKQVSILTILHMQVFYLLLVIADHGAVAVFLSLCSRGGNIFSLSKIHTDCVVTRN